VNYTGTVIKQVDAVLGEVVVTESANFQMVEISVGGTVLMTFPLPLSADQEELTLRICNVVFQTGLVDRSVRVELAPV